MLIRPKGTTKESKENIHNFLVVEQIYADTYARLNPDEINLSFREYYESYVFCKQEQLKQIDQNVDVIIFTGYAGAGHFAPSRALALTYESNGKNVIMLDLLSMVWPTIANISCNSWLYVSRHNQLLFKATANLVGKESFSQIALGLLKHMNIDFLVDFIKSKNVRVCISTFLSASAIASKIAKHVNFFGVLVPDASAIGMSCELFKNTENIVYFTVNEETIEDAKKRYSYHNKSKEFIITTVVPNFVDKSYNLNPYSDLLTWVIGGGMGLGYGIRALDAIIKAYKGPIVIVCGDNKSWYNRVMDAKYDYLHSTIYPLKYCTPEIIKLLMQKSKIIIGKPGGSTMAEFASMRGCKILYGAVKGHEEQNAEYAESMKVVRYARNINELVKEIKNPVPTESIYTSNFIKKHPSDTIVDYTLNYF
jgi:UDP-N-acetylglucosamine:LPS N-acetylglucosamine transferase